MQAFDPIRFKQDETGQWWYHFGLKKPCRTRAHVKVCAWCGEDFLTNPTHNNSTYARAVGKFYCSKSCGLRGFVRDRPDRWQGENSRRWKGGRQIVRGYAFVFQPDHPACQDNKRKYVAEHRLVMEKRLGRYLLPNEQVHHKNGDKLDNADENLELWVIQQPAGQRVTEQKHCPTCTCNGD